jgi:TolA-binding protein
MEDYSMKSEPIKRTDTELKTIITPQKKIRQLEIQIDKLQNKILKLENKTLKQEQQIIKLKSLNAKLEEGKRPLKVVVTHSVVPSHKPPEKLIESTQQKNRGEQE